MQSAMLATGLPPLATPQNFFDAVNRALQDGPKLDASSVLLIGLGVLIVVFLLYAKFRDRKNEPRTKPQIDALEMAAKWLDLSGQERQDLKRIAERARLSQPAALLLSPANLAQAAQPLTDGAEDRRLRERLESLCIKLFETPLPEA